MTGLLQEEEEVLAFLLAGSGVVLAAREAKPFRDADARGDREDTVREEARIAHALRYHADAGIEFRGMVTDRADRIRSWATVGVVAWLLVSVCASGSAVLHSSTTARIVAACVALVAVLALIRSQRRGRWARRWLDEPLRRP